MARKVEIRSRRDALARVATSLIGHVHASTYDELLGAATPLNAAEAERMDWAVAYIQDRLARMVPPA
jgi:hypothetical protein